MCMYNACIVAYNYKKKNQFIYKPALWDSRILVVNPLNSQVI